jgi:hypothetical protein
MVTVVGICNMALSHVGNKARHISALTDANEPARQCNLWYEPVRDATLQAHPWNFAIRRATLALTSETPTFGYAYAYALPDDCLKVVRTEDEEFGIQADYRIEGQLGSYRHVLLTDIGDEKIEYIAKVTDPNAFSPTFVQTLAVHLAAKICKPLTEDKKATEQLYQLYGSILREARSVDAQEGTPRGLFANNWTGARY